MRLVTIFTLLISLMLLGVSAVYAEETTVEETVIEEISENPVEMATVTIEDSSAFFTPESSFAFGKIHRGFLMSTEEAFAYLLSGNVSEKEAYLNQIGNLNQEVAAFQAVGDLNWGNNTTTALMYDTLIMGIDDSAVLAEEMFVSFEENGTADEDAILAYEDQVDSITNTLEMIWAENRSIAGGPLTEMNSIGKLYVYLFSALEEFYAYPVIGDVMEKDDAYAQLDYVDEFITEHEANYPDSDISSLKKATEDLREVTGAMIATYETQGAANEEDIIALEIVAEEIEEGYLAYVNEISGTSELSSV